jgi:putative nucleotidyltransferase with HDIG domain
MKTKILFVDDEINVLDGLKRMLHKMKNSWEMDFVDSGAKAIELMQHNNYDIIMSDMRMPGIDGAALLKWVKENSPKTIRFVLSGFSDKEAVIKTTLTAHQYLAKPCKPEILVDKVESVSFLIEKLNSDALLKLVNRLHNLPTLPEIYFLLEEELHKDAPSIQRINEIVSCDAALSAKVLQLVNSAYWSSSKKIQNPLQAINILGLDNLKSLVLFTDIFLKFTGPADNTQAMKLIWNHSLKVAKVSRALFSHLYGDQNQSDTIFISGLLHDIGKVILLYIGSYSEEAKKKLLMSDKSLVVYEKNTIGTTHADLGSYLLGAWGLPREILEIVAFHHFPSEALRQSNEAIGVIYLANIIAELGPIDFEFIKNFTSLNKIESFVSQINDRII